MRSRSLALSAVCAVVAAVDVAAPVAAQAATVIHVRQVVGCSDTAPAAGSDAVPYCTVSAAVAVAVPGQDISVGDGAYDESVTVTHSGTPGSPITISAEPGATPILNGFFDGNNPGAHPGPVGVTLRNVHDVVVEGLGLMGFAQDAVLVAGSGNIVLDGLNAQNTVGAVVEITGASSNATLSRSRLTSSNATAVYIHGGAQAVTVSTNDINGQYRSPAGIAADGAPGTILTGNTVSSVADGGIVLEHGSTGSTIENNVLIPYQSAIPVSGTPMLSVDTSSEANTKADYNVVQAGANFVAYSWAGAIQASQAAFTAASGGQGAHDVVQVGDLNAGPWLSEQPLEHDPRIDSADADAPGELPTDLDGNPAVDDPLVPNTGTGTGYRDRGAVEFRDPLTIQHIGFEPSQAPIGTPVTVTATAGSQWSPHLTYTFAFDDGSPATVSGSSNTVQHVFTQAGTRKVTVTITDDLGGEAGPDDVFFGAGTPGPLTPVLTLRLEGSGAVMADEWQSTDPWPITAASFTFGDGSPSVPTAGSPLATSAIHTYTKSGTYTVTLTLTDYAGRTASTSQKVTVDLPGGGTTTPPPVPGSAGPKTYRDAGADRIGTGIAISRQRWAAGGSAKAVVLATSSNYPDALSGGPLAAKKGGPLLLTDGSAPQLDPRVLAEIQRVLPAGGAIHVLGGDSAMNPAIVSRLKRLGYVVTQYKGADRADTALRVARDGLGSPQHVVLATGAGFADALAAGPYAAGPFADAPGAPAAIVLSDGARLAPATAAFLNGKTVATVGAQAGRAWPDAVKSFSGLDRFDTAARVAHEFTGAFANTQVGIANGVASGTNPGYPDALTGGAFMAESSGPIVLVDGISGTIPPVSQGALAGRISNVRADIFGGTGIISPDLAATIVGLLHGIAQF